MASSPSSPFTPAHLVDVLRRKQTEEACSACIDRLETYITAQIGGSFEPTQHKETAMHLDSCISCSTAYELLYDVIEAEQNGTLPIPAAIPTPNLDFLGEKVSLTDKLRDAVRVTAEKLTVQLDQLLLSLLVQEQAGQPAMVRSGGDGRYTNKLFELSSSQLPGEMVPLKIAAFKDNEQAGVALVEVNVEPPGKTWPDLANYEVNLSTRSQEETAVTNEWGTAVFPAVNIQYLGTLRLQVIFQ